MEYHGMGTRSWASMLTSKAFAEVNIARHERESKPITNILLVEEPEAHLHPNAQKTLYSQLESFNGQVLVSTHSPYLAAMINVNDVRALMKNNSGISCNQVRYEMTSEERKILGREIWNKRGELLFAKGLILAEGITEEQVIPTMFKVFFDEPMYALGVTCISVGGKNYAPFLKLACSFRIPVLIVSDNDGNTKKELSNQFKNINKRCEMDLFKEKFGIYYVEKGDDFEKNLLRHGLRQEIIEAFVLAANSDLNNDRYAEAKRKELVKLTDEVLIEKMRDSKANYSGFLADVLLENPYSKPIEKLILPAVKNAFEDLMKWCSL
jgi:putative ATP-dependent endonuclease of OLD family